MRFERHEKADSRAAMRSAMAQVTGMLESVIAENPDQWFNFYDVWSQPASRAPEPPHA